MQHLTTNQQVQKFLGSGALDDQDVKFIEECKKHGATEMEAVNKLIDEYKEKAFPNGWTFDEHAGKINDANQRAAKV